MKKLIGLLAAGLLILFSVPSYAYQMYQRVQVKPVIIQGVAEISSLGKDVKEEDEGNILKAYNVDVHQVNINDAAAKFNGVNLVQYVPTNDNIAGASVEQKFYKVKVAILSKNKGKAFVVFAGKSASYKIILDADKKLVSIEEYQSGGLVKSWEKSFNIRLYKVYQIYFYDEGASYASDRGKIEIEEYSSNNGVSFSTVNVIESSLNDLKLDPISDDELFDFFVGAESSAVTFFDEEIRIFSDV